MTTHDTELRTVLDWCATHHDASTALKRDAKRCRQQLDAATHTLTQLVSDNDSELHTIRARQNDALRALLDEPTRGNVRNVSDTIALLDDTQQRTLREVRAAEQAAVHARHQASTALQSHWRDLLHLVATERCRNVTACGNDAVPTEVHWAWRLVNFRWHPTWDDALHLPAKFYVQPFSATARDLPLTWNRDEPATYRASVAWVWQQVAAGNCAAVSVPLRPAERSRGLRPGTHGACLRVTSQVEHLPQVPPATR